MSAPVLDRPNAADRSQAGERCPQCGGSGQLRIGAASYRTCLKCAGSGVQEGRPA